MRNQIGVGVEAFEYGGLNEQRDRRGCCSCDVVVSVPPWNEGVELNMYGIENHEKSEVVDLNLSR